MRRGQLGVALVTALLVVALGTLLSVSVTRGLLLDLRRSGHLAALEQAQQYARGLEAWAMAILAEDLAATGAVDHPGELWGRGIPFIDVPGGRLAGRMVDLDGRFNVNNLVIGGVRQDGQVAIFRRLLLTLGLNGDLADVVVDWLDGDGLPERRGAEDAAYGRLDPSYRPANAPMAHVSELRAVLGIDADAYARLEPHVTALPVADTPTLFNVNTATPELLSALDERLSLAVARELSAAGGARFQSVDAFLAHPRLQALPLAPLRTLISVESRHFLAIGEVEVADTSERFFALIRRSRAGSRTLLASRGSF